MRTEKICRAGGWGYLLGDEGSAFAIARAGLQAAVQSTDSRREPTQLLPMLMTALEVDSAEALIEQIYGSPNPRERIAQLAKSVFDAADAGDHCAKCILEDAASQLADMVNAIRTGLQFPRESPPLAVTGSVLIHQPQFLHRILKLAGIPHVSPVVVQEPVQGAVSMASRMLAEHERRERSP